ncbi:MAG: hypothetical protein ACXVY3_01225 [Gaiellaceae bacterium]
MRIVLAIVVQKAPPEPEARHVVCQQVRYHLEQGVDHVLGVADGATGELFAGFGREGRFRYVEAQEPGAAQSRRRVAQLAVDQHHADWLLECAPGELWWSRRGSLRELLEAVPARFEAIRGLQRDFVARPDTGEPFFERTIVRRRLLAGAMSGARLRLVRRAAVKPEGTLVLRDWYPLELLRFPLGQQEIVDDAALAAGLADGSLRRDTRVCDALQGESTAASTIAEELELAEELEAGLEALEESSLFPVVESLDRRLVTLERAGALAPAAELRRILGRRRRRTR